MKNIVMVIICTFVLMICFSQTTATAAKIKWKKTPYSHYAQGEEVKDVLTDFFAAQGIGVICSENVKGKVSGRFEEKDPQRFFKHITDAYNLIWYYDGAAVYVYSAHEITSRILNLGYLNMKNFKKSLNKLGILDPNFALRIIEKERIVYVSGPERYVQLVSDLAEQLDVKAMAQRSRDDVIRVFTLKYAWAADKTVNFRDRELTLPGVATMLRNLITGNTTPAMVAENDNPQINATLSKLKGKGLARHRKKTDQQDTKNGSDTEETTTEDKKDKHQPTYVETDIGFIQADTRQNAVVVRDREEKMPYYERIIRLLDVPAGLVEIRATIIDVDRNNLESLGIQWEFAANTSDNSSIKGGQHTTLLHNPDDGLQLPLGDGLNIATIVGDTADFFLTRVHALQKKGNAKILSRPSVLTMNNLEAQLEHSKTFYVDVPGKDEVDLFDITAGVVLRVTPHIIKEDDNTLIKLAIQIEDGEILRDEAVDGIPMVKKSIINTQAVVGQKESLLIGGYMKERNITTQKQVPCLGDVPLLGWLFKDRSTTGDESERLFLITPTIVPYANNRGAEVLKEKGIEF